MNSIVRSNYPISKLPADLREGVDQSARATVVVTIEDQPSKTPSLEDIFSARQPPFRKKEEIDTELRQQRDEWDA